MSTLEAEYRLEYFEEEEGFTRKECPDCGDFFWTRDEDRETCGEPPCAEYAFIGNPSLDEEYSLEEMREAFLSFSRTTTTSGSSRIRWRRIAGATTFC